LIVSPAIGHRFLWASVKRNDRQGDELMKIDLASILHPQYSLLETQWETFFNVCLYWMKERVLNESAMVVLKAYTPHDQHNNNNNKYHTEQPGRRKEFDPKKKLIRTLEKGRHWVSQRIHAMQTLLFHCLMDSHDNNSNDNNNSSTTKPYKDRLAIVNFLLYLDHCYPQANFHELMKCLLQDYPHFLLKPSRALEFHLVSTGLVTSIVSTNYHEMSAKPSEFDVTLMNTNIGKEESMLGRVLRLSRRKQQQQGHHHNGNGYYNPKVVKLLLDEILKVMRDDDEHDTDSDGDSDSEDDSDHEIGPLKSHWKGRKEEGTLQLNPTWWKAYRKDIDRRPNPLPHRQRGQRPLYGNFLLESLYHRIEIEDVTMALAEKYPELFVYFISQLSLVRNYLITVTPSLRRCAFSDSHLFHGSEVVIPLDPERNSDLE
jgi:hypothetical protein